MKRSKTEYTEREKFRLQDEEYAFPYHYLPALSDQGRRQFHFGRELPSGAGYLCYMKTYAEYINKCHPSSYADIGCGDGRIFSFIDRDIRQAGIDLSARAVKFAQAFQPHADISCKDVNDLPAEKYDMVSVIEVLEHIPDDRMHDFIKGVFNTVRTGGHVLISVPTVNLKPLPSKHYRHYTAKLLHEQLAAAGVCYSIETEKYVMRYDRKYKWLVRLCNNRILRFRFLDGKLWEYCWNHLRDASQDNGIHLLLVLRKVEDRSL